MEKLITGLFANITKFFLLIFFLGTLLGFVCSNGIFTINYNPDNAKMALQKTTTNFGKNGKVLVESFHINGDSDSIERPGYVTNSKQNPKIERKLFAYRVKRGENLYDIGRKYNVNWKVLMRINHIQDPNQIYPDDIVLIPDFR